MRIRPAVTTSLSIAALVAVAALPLRDVFGDWRWAISVLGAAFAGAVAASVLESIAPRLPSFLAVTASAVLALVWTLTVSLRELFWSDPVSRDVGRELGDGLSEGWGALLDETFPLTDPQSAEIFAALLTWVAAAVGVHIAARFRTPLAGAAAAAAVLWIATAAALPSGLAPPIVGAGAGAFALIAVATTTRAPSQRWGVGRALTLLLVILGSSSIALIGADASARLDREPVDPRASQDVTSVSAVVPDILAQYGELSDAEDVALVLDGPPISTPIRLRLQVYDTHDGERWLPASGFEEIATFPEPPVLPPGDVVAYAADLEDVPGPWIPLPDRLISLDVGDIRWNEDAQTALATRALDRYRFTGTAVPRTDLENLDLDTDGLDPAVSEIPPGLPDVIRAEAQAAAEQEGDVIATIAAITARVRELGREESRAPGHSLARLRDDLAEGRATGAEQIASLHALMLRAVGIPSRVVVGYVATGPVVEASDLHIWVEAPLAGIGWYATEPVPASEESPPDPENDATVPSTSLPQNTALRAQALPEELGPGEDPDEDAISGRDDITAREVFLYCVLGLGLLLVVTAALRVIRRRFRQDASRRAEARILGAWAEFVDRLREAGAPIAVTTTIADAVYMAEMMDERLGDEAGRLGALASETLHGPFPSTTADAGLAWDHLRAIESTLAGVRGRHTVALRYLDPRVLRHRAPRSPSSRGGGRRSRVTSR